MADETQDLNATLDDMREKSQALNDSLTVLSREGLEQLTRVVTRAQNGPLRAARQTTEDIVNRELLKFAREQMLSGIAAVFGARLPSREKSAAAGADRGLQVIIHNNTSASVTAEQSVNAFNQKQLEITIDQMVASSLVRGQQTSGILRTLFGLAPNLIGR